MPPWGRPSGGKPGKKRGGRERQQRQWQEQMRFEELGSDSDDGEGVVLDRFAGDELHFTGADLGQRTRNRRKYEFSDESEDEDEDGDDILDQGANMQLALRDKEEVLVERAMERIRRARLLGMASVKLPPPERDALKRKMEADRIKAKGKRPTLTQQRSSEGRRSAGRSSSSVNLAGGPSTSRKGSRSSLNRPDEPGPFVTVGPPGFVVPGPDGQPMYAPIGYYPPPPNVGSRPGSRPDSGPGSMALPNPASPQKQGRGPQKRIFSVPEQPHATSSRGAPRPLPDDIHWHPRARSASNNLAYPVDPYQYQAYQPPMQQIPQPYPANRRVSMQQDVGYPNLRPTVLPRDYGSSGREHSSGSGQRDSPSEEDDDDDGEYDGVQVDVVPYGQGYDVNFSGTGGGRGKKGRR